jgi:hypothetical protein
MMAVAPTVKGADPFTVAPASDTAVGALHEYDAGDSNASTGLNQYTLKHVPGINCKIHYNFSVQQTSDGANVLHVYISAQDISAQQKFSFYGGNWHYRQRQYPVADFCYIDSELNYIASIKGSGEVDIAASSGINATIFGSGDDIGHLFMLVIRGWEDNRGRDD